MPSRLAVGKQARVLKILNFHSGAGTEYPVFHVNFPGTMVQIIDGPVCQPYGSAAYLWWKVQETGGATGWSAEGEQVGKFYYMEPVP